MMDQKKRRDKILDVAKHVLPAFLSNVFIDSDNDLFENIEKFASAALYASAVLVDKSEQM